ncbi:MAG: potI [Rickettsiaceae bacterium]|jgi:putrescine transport system permease protein|nr:potI [Rickettsiaceae bacterium]
MGPKKRFPWVLFLMSVGFAFLYIPIFILIFYSFNSSKLVTVWAGFSTQWYSKLWEDTELMSAVGVSLKVAASSASLAVIIGTLAGVVLSRFGLFAGRSLFSGLLSSPFVMPEVVTGFSLLLLFISAEQLLGIPEGRSITTIILTHSTLGMAFVAVLVQARLAAFDISLEEAALDLGAKPMKVFFVITIPLIMPALIAGWLLAFTLSFDDLVLASFTSGPGSTTLPMLIYSRVRLGVSPEINALATIIVVAVTILAAITGALTLRSGKTQK